MKGPITMTFRLYEVVGGKKKFYSEANSLNKLKHFNRFNLTELYYATKNGGFLTDDDGKVYYACSSGNDIEN